MLGAVSATVISATFGGAAALKMRSLAVFAEHIAEHAFVPYRLTRPLAVAVVAAEGAIAVLLLVPSLRHIAAGAATALLVAFAGIQVRAILQGRRIACACFGGGTSEVIGAHTLVRSITLAALGLVAAFSESAPAGGIAFGFAVLLGLLVVLLTETTRLLVDLRNPMRDLVAAVTSPAGRDRG